MSEIVFYCSKCGAKLAAGAEESGDEFECPKCNSIQMVPGEKKQKPVEVSSTAEKAESEKIPSVVVRIPKRKVYLSDQPDPDEDDEEDAEEVYVEEIGGGGLRVLAVALGTVGLVLCGLSLSWVVISMDRAEMDWWFKIMIFISTFLTGLMGLMLASFAFLVVRMANRIEDLEVTDE